MNDETYFASLVDQTAITPEQFAGEVSGVLFPSFPAEATTVTPFESAYAIAPLNVWSQSSSAPKERLTTSAPLSTAYRNHSTG